MTPATTPFELIRRTNPAGNEFWSSRDFGRVLSYTDYRNFEAVVEKARTACFNSGQRVDDQFVEIDELIETGRGGCLGPESGWIEQSPARWVIQGYPTPIRMTPNTIAALPILIDR
ncbi:hypothetical protein [Holophaga foetida]|uniref:hypothetical protein n=1 Tax=Holophaga foetida TaxID=35839 RepID=UPI0002472F0F|nr:hypothetical protein [Holophaga foetida]